ncbi:hypothetical protein AB0G04_18220 [Actinoplanes sp. NPDC023801]|uniref:hypothetical protein n=1 Tax=Actinoplanes sp. NPDC023801 TaxID=3154595 RepID=UPI0033FEB19C
MTIFTKRTATSTLGALAVFGLAGSLLTGAAASAGPPTGRPAAAAPAQAAAQNLAPACWTSVSQPGGKGNTIYVTYRNCGNVAHRVTVSSSAVNGSGTFTYVGWCVSVPAGDYHIREVTREQFPGIDTHRYTMTNCL